MTSYSAQVYGPVPGGRHDHDGEFSASCGTCQDDFLEEREQAYRVDGCDPREATSNAARDWCDMRPETD